MKYKSLIYYFLLIILLLSFSCSHQNKKTTLSIVSTSSGLMKNNSAPFSIYLTGSLVSRVELEKKYADDIFIIHSGHLLKPDLTKTENEANLRAVCSLGINLVNLTLEDFLIAESQGINFENYNQNFLNSSVWDLSLDTLASAKNIHSYEIKDGLVFIGLSDTRVDKKIIENRNKELRSEKYIINDYVLSILKAKSAALHTAKNPISQFNIIHTIGNEINEIMTRLPPSFINSLAD